MKKIIFFIISLTISILLIVFIKKAESLNLEWVNCVYPLIAAISCVITFLLFFHGFLSESNDNDNDYEYFISKSEKVIDKETEAFNQLKNIDFKYIEKFIRKEKLKSLK